jgi:hypothetical protein
VKDCTANPKGDACVLDLQSVSSDAAKAVLDLSTAITFCATGQNVEQAQKNTFLKLAQGPSLKALNKKK